MGDKVIRSYKAFLVLMRERALAGFLYLIPFVITVVALMWVYNTAASVLQPFLPSNPEFVLPLVTATLLLVFPLLIGLVLPVPGLKAGFTALTVFAKRMPLAGVGEGISMAIDPATKRGLNRVVLVEYPRRGLWAFGFLTSEMKSEDGEKWAVVFLPTAPLPSSGWVTLVRYGEVYEVGIEPTEAMRITLSAGMLTPERFTRSSLKDEAESRVSPDGVSPNWTGEAERTHAANR